MVHSRFIALALSVMLVGAACTAPSAAPQSAAPKVDTTNLVVGVPSLGTQKWEPWLAASAEDIVTAAVAESLTRRNPQTGKLEGNLAESWSLSPDGKTWSFKLRPNIPFHDGLGNVTAEDVKFSYQMFIREDSLQGRAGAYRRAIGNNLSNFQIVSPLEFTLTTTTPVVAFDSLTSDQPPNLLIYSKKYFDADPQMAVVHPIGTGPYKFVSSTLGVEAKLQAVENHWRQAPTFKNLTFKIITDDAARLAQLQSGAVDLASIPPALVQEARGSGLRIQSIPEGGSLYLNFGGNYPGIGVDYNKEESPAKYDRNAPYIQADNAAKGLAVRQAMSLAINRQQLLDKLLGGQGSLLSAPNLQWPSNPTQMDSRWAFPKFDLQQAKQKLAEGGYPNGFTVTMPLFDLPGRPGMKDIGEGIAGMWEALGLKVTRMPVDFATFRPRLVDHTTGGTVFVYSANRFPDDSPDAFGPYTPFAIAIYIHPAAIDAYQKAQLETNADKRRQLTILVLNTFVQDASALPLFTFNIPYAAGPRVGTWEPVVGVPDISRLETVKPPK